MYTNFLVPFDGSISAYHAVEAAIDMGCSGANVDITVLQVQRMTDAEHSSFDVAAKLAELDRAESKVADDAQMKTSQETVQAYFDRLPENVDLNIVIKRGNPADVICEYAHDNGIDCIVMGRRGIGGIRAVLGSVSTAVLRDSNLPVLAVK